MDPKKRKKKLFSEFPPISTSEWDELIRSDLKGADYNKKLIWKTGEGFDVRPYYRQEDLSGMEWLKDFSSRYLLNAGKKQPANTWIIRQDFPLSDIRHKPSLFTQYSQAVYLLVVSGAGWNFGYKILRFLSGKQWHNALKRKILWVFQLPVNAIMGDSYFFQNICYVFFCSSMPIYQ